MTDHPCLAVIGWWRRLDDPPGLVSVPGDICGRLDAEKPMAFRGEDWCCKNHHDLVDKLRQDPAYNDDMEAVVQKLARRSAEW